MKKENVDKYKKNYQVCSQKGSNAHKLNFQPEFSTQLQQTGVTGFLCAGSLTVLADRGLGATVKCPLDGAVFEKAKYHGQVCPVCGMCKLGEDVLGLSI